MELLLTIRDFIAQTIYILTMLALIVFFLAVNGEHFRPHERKVIAQMASENAKSDDTVFH